MLERIRSYTKGWTAWVIISFIIFIFVVLGLEGLIGAIGGPGSKNISIYGEQVTEQQIQAFKELFGADFAPLAAQIGYLKSQGLYISKEQIDQSIIANPQFAMDGKYDPMKFSSALHSNEGYIQAYRDYVSYQLYAQQQYDLFTMVNFFPAWQVATWYQVLQQQRDFAVVEIPYNRYLDSITITEQEAQQYYQNNLYKFISSEKVKIQYVSLNAADVAMVEPTGQQLEDYYHSNLAKFAVAEQRSLAQILIRFGDKRTEQQAERLATELEQQLAAGSNFAELAKKYSDDYTAAAGGGAGWFGRKDLPSEALVDAVFSLTKSGDVSKPVAFNNGIYIFKLLAIKGGQEKNFTEVRSQVMQEVKQQLRDDKFAELKNQLEDKLYNNEPLTKIAKDMNLPLTESGYFTRQGGSSEVTANSAVIVAAFSNAVVNDKQTSNLIELSANNIIVLSDLGHIPSEQQSFDVVKETVFADLKIAKAQQVAKAKADQALQDFSSSDIKKIASKNGWKIIERQNIAVSTISDKDSEISPYFIKEIFAMPRSKTNTATIKAVRDEQGNYALLVLNKVMVPDPQKADPKKLADIKTQLESGAVTQDIVLIINDIEQQLKR